MSFTTQPFFVDSFEGGITDNYLDGVPNRYRYAVNFIVTRNKKLFTRPGSLIYDSTNYQIPAGAQRIGSLIPYFTTDVFFQSSKNLYYISSGWQTLTGPSSNPVFNAGATASIVSSAFWNGQLILTSDAYPVPQKVLKDSGGAYRVRNAGLPALANNPTVTAGAAGANSYIYAFTYHYTYTVGSVTFASESEVAYVSLGTAAAPNASAVAITVIPVLTNGVTNNWDTSNIVVNIYRTVNNGATFYYVGNVTNGTTTYNDNSSDATIQGNNVTLYTTDGTLDFQAPPKCKFVHIVNGVLFYASLYESSQELTNTFQQAFPNHPDATNDEFRDVVDDAITGVSSVNNIPLIFCATQTYRLDGRYERDGSGGFTKQKISDTIGCVSNMSIVRTSQGTFFAGNDGFYCTDGLQFVNLSTEFSTRYKSFVANIPPKISGTYDPIQDRVLWAVSENGTENDTIYCLHLKYGIRPDACFTTWNGTDGNFKPTYLLFFQKKLLRADTRGYIFKHDDTIYYDSKINTATNPSTWSKKTIIYNYESSAFNFNTAMIRKWVTRMVINASNETKLSLGIQTVNDAGRKTFTIKPLLFIDTMIWGEEDVTWGDANVTWGFDGVIEQSRLFPAGSLRCSYKQLVFTNAYALMDKSEFSGKATTNNGAHTVVLNNANAVWITNAIDQYISFSGDNYKNSFLITARTDTTLTISDPNGLMPSGSYDWQINGYPPGQILNLLNYNLEFAYIGKTQTPYRPAE